MSDIQDPARAQRDQDDAGSERVAVSSSPPVQDESVQLSVGIDIGFASTQVVFFRLHLRRRTEEPTGRSFVVGHESLYESPIALTPYLGEERIDGQAIGRIIDAAYTAAGFRPDSVDTGAVILTGGAQHRENAKAIVDAVGEKGEKFLWVRAGHHMEAMLAAYGSGAAEASERRC